MDDAKRFNDAAGTAEAGLLKIQNSLNELFNKNMPEGIEAADITNLVKKVEKPGFDIYTGEITIALSNETTITLGFMYSKGKTGTIAGNTVEMSKDELEILNAATIPVIAYGDLSSFKPGLADTQWSGFNFTTALARHEAFIGQSLYLEDMRAAVLVTVFLRTVFKAVPGFRKFALSSTPDEAVKTLLDIIATGKRTFKDNGDES